MIEEILTERNFIIFASISTTAVAIFAFYVEWKEYRKELKK